MNFPKTEKLKSQKVIQSLVKGSDSLAKHPVRLVWRIPEGEGHTIGKAMVTFSVSKRNFKRSVDRNLLKRRMREAWRLNKENLNIKLTEMQIPLAILVIYQGKEEFDFHAINYNMAKCIARMTPLIKQKPQQ